MVTDGGGCLLPPVSAYLPGVNPRRGDLGGFMRAKAHKVSEFREYKLGGSAALTQSSAKASEPLVLWRITVIPIEKNLAMVSEKD